MERLHSLKLWRFFPCTWTPTAHKSVQSARGPRACTFVFACTGKIKSQGNHISRKCHWLPLHPQSHRCHYTTAQISHHEDEWVHKNTITYHLACRIPRELLTVLLIRAIGEEVHRPEFPAKKSWIFDKYLHGASFLAHMTNQACGHMPRHISTRKQQYITITRHI